MGILLRAPLRRGDRAEPARARARPDLHVRALEHGTGAGAEGRVPRSLRFARTRGRTFGRRTRLQVSPRLRVRQGGRRVEGARASIGTGRVRAPAFRARL